METLFSTRFLVVLSMIYGGTIAVLGATGSSAVSLVALIGALVLGILWAICGMYGKREES